MADGQPILLNHIFRTPGGCEGSGKNGQLAIDISPTNPHTTGRQVRTCESCHTDPKALGYGINGGKDLRSWDEEIVVELESADKHILPKQYQVQRERIAGLVNDWSRIVTEDGRQQMTIGHHFTSSRPLNNAERANMNRAGVCLSCLQEILEQDLAVSLLRHIAEYTGQIPKSADEHNALVHKIMLLAAWVQAVGIVLGPVAAVVLVGLFWRWRRQRSARKQAR